MSRLSDQKKDSNKNSPPMSNNHENQDLSVNDSHLDDNSDDHETFDVANNAKFIEILEHSRQRHQTEGGISLEDMRNRLGLNKAVDDR